MSENRENRQEDTTRTLTTHSPIVNRVGKVFVPVSDMARSISWYSRLLGVAAGEAEGGLYELPMQGEAQIVLDGREAVPSSARPLFSLWTPDLDSARRFLLEKGIPVIGGARIGAMEGILFRDPDGNLLMAGQSTE